MELEASTVRAPTQREHKLVLVRLKELEAQLHDERRRKSEPLRVEHAVYAHTTSTRAAIQRDKAMSRKLEPLIDSMSLEERDELMGDVCRTLSVSTPHAVRDGLAKLTAAVAAIPALESFVGSVLTLVERDHAVQQRQQPPPPPLQQQKQQKQQPPQRPKQLTPQGVLRELYRWQKERAEFLQLQASFQAEDEQAQGQPPPRRSPAPAAAAARSESPAKKAAAPTTADDDGFASPPLAASGAQPRGAEGVCSALCALMEVDEAEVALQRASGLLARTTELETNAVALALALHLRPSATLQQCVARVRATSAAEKDSSALLRGDAARALLDRLGAHDAPSALRQLERLEAQNKLYRDVFGRYQAQMSQLVGGDPDAARLLGEASAVLPATPPPRAPALS